MEYCREMMTRDGEPLMIRSLTNKEAHAALFLMHRCMGETPFLARYPDEITLTVSQEAQYIEEMNAKAGGLLLGAFLGREITGLCNIRSVAPNERYHHRADMGIMVAKKHWGKGIGSAMMQTLIEAAKETAFEQIELDVVSTNSAAIALYQKHGFVRYGLLERGMKYRDGSYADLLLMKLDLTKLR